MIKLLVMDVDGTLTDGKIYMGIDGEILKAFNIKDGCGISQILIPSGIIPVIITGRKSEIVNNRCKELGIVELHQGVIDKLEKLKELTKKYKCNLSDIAYIGDDINDLNCMKEIKKNSGLLGCPFDASNEIKDISDYITTQSGGNGAVRDFIEWIVNNYVSISRKVFQQ